MKFPLCVLLAPATKESTYKPSERQKAPLTFGSSGGIAGPSNHKIQKRGLHKKLEKQSWKSISKSWKCTSESWKSISKSWKNLAVKLENLSVKLTLGNKAMKKKTR